MMWFDGNQESRADFEASCKSRLATKLETAVLQRLAIADNPKLQEDIKDIASGYLDILLEQVNIRKTITPIKKNPSLENHLKHEHWQRIRAHVSDWNRQSQARIVSHTDSMDRYVSYLKDKWSANLKYMEYINGMAPGSDDLRQEAAQRIIGGIIKSVLDAIDPKRLTRRDPKHEQGEYSYHIDVSEKFDPAQDISFLTDIQKEIVEFLENRTLRKNSPSKG